MECLMTGAAGGEFGVPSWSPDGRSLAWAEGNGVWTAAIGHDCAGSPRLTIPGAREPDWGPAGAAAASPARPAVRTAGTIGRRALQRRGLKVGVSCASTCRARATAARRGRVVARATKRVAGRGRLTLRPERVRRGPLSVRVRVRPNGGAPASFTRRVLVR
jgi:hypothetical protein